MAWMNIQLCRVTLVSFLFCLLWWRKAFINRILKFQNLAGAEAKTGCIAFIKWLWALVKRLVISKLKKIQENQVLAVTDASASLSLATSSSSSEMGATVGGESSSTAVELKYDVYLSFGAPDTRKGVIYEIQDRLQRRGIKTFMDDRDLEVGNPVPPTLLQAIRESKFAIVVLSRDYACSTWCLEELRMIYECMEEDQNRIFPVLYHVQPYNVRLRKRSVDEAYCTYETCGGSEKMQQWSEVLEKVASFPAGWNTEKYDTHKELVEVIVKSIALKVQPDAIESKEDFEEHKEAIQVMEEETKEVITVSSAPQWNYDVFLNFRGPDARKGIASTLCHKLEKRGIRTFMDRGLKKGKHNSSILTAIEESRSAIVILSPKYASSAWCLNELATIVHGWENKNTLVFPVFYNVEPYHVRHQMGTFEELCAGHDEKKHTKKVKQWKAALTKVADLIGFELDKYGSEKELVHDIVRDVCSQLRDLEIKSPGNFPKFRTTERAIVKLAEAIKEDDITAVFLHGVGGIARKTAVDFVSNAMTLWTLYKTTVCPFNVDPLGIMESKFRSS